MSEPHIFDIFRGIPPRVAVVLMLACAGLFALCAACAAQDWITGPPQPSGLTGDASNIPNADTSVADFGQYPLPPADPNLVADRHGLAGQ